MQQQPLFGERSRGKAMHPSANEPGALETGKRRRTGRRRTEQRGRDDVRPTERIRTHVQQCYHVRKSTVSLSLRLAPRFAPRFGAYRGLQEQMVTLTVTPPAILSKRQARGKETAKVAIHPPM